MPPHSPDIDLTPRPNDSTHDRLYKSALTLLDGQIPTHGVPLPKLGFFARRRIRKAIRLLDQVTQMNPANWAAFWVKGKAFQRLGEFAFSLDAFANSHRIKPDQPDVAREAGLAAMSSGKLDLAIEYTTRAIQNDPDDPGLQANLALAHLFAQQPDVALRLAQEALSRDPSDQVTQNIVAIARDVIEKRFPCPHNVTEAQKWHAHT